MERAINRIVKFGFGEYCKGAIFFSFVGFGGDIVGPIGGQLQGASEVVGGSGALGGE